jgi:hypothetical protein
LELKTTLLEDQRVFRNRNATKNKQKKPWVFRDHRNYCCFLYRLDVKTTSTDTYCNNTTVSVNLFVNES